MIHDQPHPLAGQTVKLTNGQEYRLEDWVDRLAGKSWMVCDGNPACLIYAVHSAQADLPTDDEVVYGKVGAMGVLCHVSELAEGGAK